MKRIIFKFRVLISLLLIFFSTSFLFLGGYFSNDARFERVADYASLVAQNQCNGGIFSLSVENVQKKGNMISPDQELYNLYGIFKQEKITFASTINATKQDHSILIHDDPVNNLSMLYVGPTGSIEYKNHFKHYVFPVELMFEDNQSKAYDVSNYICYLSKSQATRLLNIKNNFLIDEAEYTEEDYKELLYTPITFDIDNGNLFDFSIINIYFEDNYYCSGLTSVMGDFVMCSYYLPMNLRESQKSLYFMSKYSYQNRYFMNYINKVYSGDKYLVTVNSYNIKGRFNSNLLTSFHNIKQQNEGLKYVFVISSFIVISSFVALFIFCKGKINFLFLLVFCFSPYFLFRIIFAISKNVLWFSFYSSKIFLIAITFLFLFCIIYKATLHKKKRIITKNYEITI